MYKSPLSGLEIRQRQMTVALARLNRSAHHVRCPRYFFKVVKAKRRRFQEALRFITDALGSRGSSLSPQPVPLVNELDQTTRAAAWLKKVYSFFSGMVASIKSIFSSKTLIL